MSNVQNTKFNDPGNPVDRHLTELPKRISHVQGTTGAPAKTAVRVCEACLPGRPSRRA